MTTFQENFGKHWLELLGRKKTAPRYPFADNEIVTPGVVLPVSETWNAVYLNLHPTHYAVAIASDSQSIYLKGGYNKLAPGRYILHFIDRQNRVAVLPQISGTTLDGSQVSLELFIIYRVTDPIKALEIQQPVETLFLFIRSDIKEFVHSHTYDEILSGNRGRVIESSLIRSYIREQQSRRHQVSKLFFIVDTVISEIQGSRQATKIMDDFKIQERIPIPNPIIHTKDYVSTNIDIKKRPKVFISYARNDFSIAREIYEYLLDHECTPWMDIYDLVPGQDWKLEIQKNIIDCDFFIACLSNHSVSKIGYVQKELKEAFSVLDEMPAGRIYLIPIRVDDCIVPFSLKGKQWLDWSSTNARALLLRAIESKDNQV